ncbi:tyrosine-type recombinase/integrase [Pseudoroseicyclus sp. H15]
MRRSLRESFMMPRVHRVRKGGKVFKYHRVSRAPLPNDIPEDHPDFVAAWQAEEGKRPPVTARAKPGTVHAGCTAYLASRDYLSLSDVYRPVIRRHVDAIARQGEGAMLRDLQQRHVEDDLAALPPAVAASRRKAWRKLGPFWKRKGFVITDPTDGVKGPVRRQTEGHKEWVPADLARFRETWAIGTPQRLACELLQWTGARCVDLVRLGPGMVTPEGLLRFHQRKTGGEVNIPWTAPAFGLEAQRRDLFACLSGNDMVYLTKQGGGARSHKAVSGWFAEAARDAGLERLTAHGLRKYRMNQLAEYGVPLLAMQTWVGHVTLEEVERYTRRASRRNVFALKGGMGAAL